MTEDEFHSFNLRLRAEISRIAREYDLEIEDSRATHHVFNDDCDLSFKLVRKRSQKHDEPHATEPTAG